MKKVRKEGKSWKDRKKNGKQAGRKIWCQHEEKAKKRRKRAKKGRRKNLRKNIHFAGGNFLLLTNIGRKS